MVVLIHGGFHNKKCWGKVVDLLSENGENVVPVSVPGHTYDSVDELKDLNIQKCVNGIISQIPDNGEKIVLVLHSMAGIFLYNLYKCIGHNRIEKIICISCCIPKHGETMLESLNGLIYYFAKFCVKRIKVVNGLPKWIAKCFFGNGMNKKQYDCLYQSLWGEGTNLLKERIEYCNINSDITWIYTINDKAILPKMQNVYIHNLKKVKQIIKIDAPHDAMISNPKDIAKVILN